MCRKAQLKIRRTCPSDQCRCIPQFSILLERNLFFVGMRYQEINHD